MIAREEAQMKPTMGLTEEPIRTLRQAAEVRTKDPKGMGGW